MFPFGVTIPDTIPQRSEILEGLTICPVLMQMAAVQWKMKVLI